MLGLKFIYVSKRDPRYPLISTMYLGEICVPFSLPTLCIGIVCICVYVDFSERIYVARLLYKTFIFNDGIDGKFV